MRFCHQIEFNNQIQFNKLAILNALCEAEIESAEIRYKGSGGSGDVSELRYFASGKPYVPTSPIIVKMKIDSTTWDATTRSTIATEVEVDTDLESAFKDFLWRCLDAQGHSGWENGKGGEGSLTVIAGKKTFRLDHTDYLDVIIDSEESLCVL